MTNSDTAFTISGNQKRKMKSASRLYAMQALFQIESSGQTSETICTEFLDHRFGADYEGDLLVEGDVDLFKNIITKAVNLQAPIDQLTDQALVAKWPLGRLDPALRALFRAAGAELLDGEAPPKVIISEYMEVASAFYPEGKEAKFVNAVLDHMARSTKPEASS